MIFKTEPYEKQREAWERAKDAPVFALLHEQGLGKTWVLLNVVAHLYGRGQADAMIVVAPNGVHANWVEREVPAHLSLPNGEWRAAAYYANGRAADKRSVESLLDPKFDGMRILAMSYDAIITEGGKKLARRFLDTFRCVLVLDESQKIKTPGSKRTKTILALGRRAVRRFIATGTPVAQSPFEFYSQFKFLDSAILGHSTYSGFKAEYGEWDSGMRWRVDPSTGRRMQQEYPVLLEYRNLDQLTDRIRPFSHRARKEDCLDLPPKVYERVYVDLQPSQRRAYGQMMRDGIALLGHRKENALEDAWLEAIEDAVDSPVVRSSNVLSQYLRLAQIAGGSVLARGESNPKLRALMDLADDLPDDRRMAAWCRFRAEADAIAAALVERFGPDAVLTYTGGADDDERERARFEFDARTARPDGPRFLVLTTQAGATGLTLTAIDLAVYYSNGYSVEQRLQSEDRHHRIGLRRAVTYVDLLARDTLDERILDLLLRKRVQSDDLMRELE